MPAQCNSVPAERNMLVLVLCTTALAVVKADIKTEIQTALNLGNASLEYTRDECIWRSHAPSACPDPDVKVILYNSKTSKGEEFDFNQSDWLQHSSWDSSLDNVVLVHGYAGGDNTFPMSMLRDAYLRNGSYNVFVLDWGRLSNLPCYPAAVHNVRTAARCVAPVFTTLRDATPGETTATTCVGHSLGAHLCGLVGEHVRFRLHRIIGLDPARPLIRNAMKLRPASATYVQVIHSNAGTYGDSGKLGNVDFCLNGGKTQPMCEIQDKADLCSHVVSLCYMAASINADTAPKAHPCARRCPSGPRPTHRVGKPILLGEHTPQSVNGFYCAATKKPMYCPQKDGDHGHPWCCLDESSAQQTLETPAPPLTEIEDVPVPAES